MDYRFTLTYLDTYSLAEQTLVLAQDPKGFADAFSSVLKRDVEFHGVFFSLTADEISLGFSGDARTIFKEQFDAFGFDAIVTIEIERRLTDYDAFSIIYTGTAIVEEISFDVDYANVAFYDANLLIDINNNKTLEVSTTATETINGTTISPAPVAEDVTLKGRKIDKEVSMEFVPVAGQTPICTLEYSGSVDISPTEIQPKINTLTYKDGTTGYDQVPYISSGGNKIFAGAILLKNGGNIDAFSVTVTASVNYDGARVLGTASGTVVIKLCIEEYVPSTDSFTYSYFDMGTVTLSATPAVGTASRSISVGLPSSASAEAGGYKRIRFAINDSSKFSDGSNTYLIDLDTFIFSINPTTALAETTCKANSFFDVINHNLSFITNENNTLRSDILGSGGTLEHLYETNGWKVRGFSRPLNGSFLDRVESLKSMFNLGYGLEIDYFGDEVIRIEEMDHFYADVQMTSFSDVESDSYKEEMAPEFLFNKVELGFEDDSSDEDEAGNIYDLHTKAQVRTPVQKLEAAYSWISKHLASDILIEILRRKSEDKFPSEKSDFDEDLFVLDCYDDGGAIKFAYPSDKNLLVSSNISNADTAGNYRLNLRFTLFNHGSLINATIYGKDFSDVYKTIEYTNVQNQAYKIGFSTLASGENDIGDTNTYAAIGDVPDLGADVSIVEVGNVLVNPIYITFKVAISESELTTILLGHKNALDSGNYGYISIVNPLGETKQGWLIEMTYMEADKIATIKMIERNSEGIQDYRITDADENRLTDADEIRNLA